MGEKLAEIGLQFRKYDREQTDTRTDRPTCSSRYSVYLPGAE